MRVQIYKIISVSHRLVLEALAQSSRFHLYLYVAVRPCGVSRESLSSFSSSLVSTKGRGMPPIHHRLTPSRNRTVHHLRHCSLPDGRHSRLTHITCRKRRHCLCGTCLVIQPDVALRTSNVPLPLSSNTHTHIHTERDEPRIV